MSDVAECQLPTQGPCSAQGQPSDAAGPQTDRVRGAKRQAVLRQVRAQREALALLSRNAPVTAQLLRDVGPPTADFDPKVQMVAADGHIMFELTQGCSSEMWH
jgi:hypothetical protein